MLCDDKKESKEDSTIPSFQADITIDKSKKNTERKITFFVNEKNNGKSM